MNFQTTKVDSDVNLKVKPTSNNSKDAIIQPELSKKNIIPRLLTSSLLVGRSGSGKSILMSYMLDNEHIFKGIFDLIILVSPTCKTDDVQLSFSADEVIDDLSEADDCMSQLMDLQKEKIEEYGANQAPLICVIFDDCVGNVKFLNSNSFTDCFVKARHYNFTVFCLTQQYKSIPKRCRLQTNNLFFFKSPDTETQAVVDDFCPPNYSKKKFLSLVNYANGDDHGFLYVNLKAPFDTRYRKNFDEIINL